MLITHHTHETPKCESSGAPARLQALPASLPGWVRTHDTRFAGGALAMREMARVCNDQILLVRLKKPRNMHSSQRLGALHGTLKRRRELADEIYRSDLLLDFWWEREKDLTRV